MTLTPIQFSDIQTTDLIYFDKDFEGSCLHFCLERDIDCLPCLTNHKVFYRRTDTGFQEEAITPARMVDSQMQIFDPRMLECFRASPILFVTTNGYLSGVVHFSDYNRPVVNTYLYNLISAYERSLRKLLGLYNLNNADMLDYFQCVLGDPQKGDQKGMACSRIRDYHDNFDRYEKQSDFQCFYLSDLIRLAEHRKIIQLASETKDLRNSVMHAHNLVDLQNAHHGNLIYDFSSFQDFFNQVRELLQDLQKINNKTTLRDFEISQMTPEEVRAMKRREPFTKAEITGLLDKCRRKKG